MVLSDDASLDDTVPIAPGFAESLPYRRSLFAELRRRGRWRAALRHWATYAVLIAKRMLAGKRQFVAGLR